MNPTLKNIIAILAGVIIGGSLNMGLIFLSPHIIPWPEGTDLSTPEGLKAGMPLMEARHFIMPIVAHALGTLLGAFVAAKLAVDNHARRALVVAMVFMFGGIMMIRMIPSPMWVNVVDLIFAYFPMAWLGWKLAGGKKLESSSS